MHRLVDEFESVHPRIPQALLRVADVRASRLETPDPLLAQQESRHDDPRHHLTGCSPAAGAPQGLGVLRLVAGRRTRRPDGGGTRRSTSPRRSTRRRAAVLPRGYVPTPLVGPWGARSGFSRVAAPHGCWNESATTDKARTLSGCHPSSARNPRRVGVARKAKDGQAQAHSRAPTKTSRKYRSVDRRMRGID